MRTLGVVVKPHPTAASAEPVGIYQRTLCDCFAILGATFCAVRLIHVEVVEVISSLCVCCFIENLPIDKCLVKRGEVREV